MQNGNHFVLATMCVSVDEAMGRNVGKDVKVNQKRMLGISKE